MDDNDNDSRQNRSYSIRGSCPCGLAVFGDPVVTGQPVRFAGIKAPGDAVDGIPLESTGFRWHPVLLWVAVVLVSAPFFGCTVVKVGSAGLSLGAAAVKTTAKVGGAAVGLAGSAIGVGGDEADEEEESQAEPGDGQGG